MSKLGIAITFSRMGFDKTIAMLATTEKIPQKCVNKAAGKGANVVRRYIRNGKIPYLSGALKGGIVRSRERSKYRGKQVYDWMFDPAKNDIFQKPIKNPGEAGGKRNHGYYPASMEYGFLTRSKGGGHRYVPGFYFLRDSTVDATPEAKKTMIDVLNDELDKEWTKK